MLHESCDKSNNYNARTIKSTWEILGWQSSSSVSWECLGDSSELGWTFCILGIVLTYMHTVYCSTICCKDADRETKYQSFSPGFINVYSQHRTVLSAASRTFPLIKLRFTHPMSMPIFSNRTNVEVFLAVLV